VRPGALVFTMRKRAALLLVVLAGLGYAAYRMQTARVAQDRQAEREAALRGQLATMRAAIKRFREEKKRPPHSLDELTPNYLRRIPTDPMTESFTTWRLTTEETVQPNADFTTSTAPKADTYVLDVHSGAGAPYSDW
jgi:general secretion pathway protein G